MLFGSSSLPYCANGIFDISFVIAFALIIVALVSAVITVCPRMGSAPLEFGLQALFAKLEDVS